MRSQACSDLLYEVPDYHVCILVFLPGQVYPPNVISRNKKGTQPMPPHAGFAEVNGFTPYFGDSLKRKIIPSSRTPHGRGQGLPSHESLPRMITLTRIALPWPVIPPRPAGVPQGHPPSCPAAPLPLGVATRPLRGPVAAHVGLRLACVSRGGPAQSGS